MFRLAPFRVQYNITIRVIQGLRPLRRSQVRAHARGVMRCSSNMQNINPWLLSAFVLALSGIFFRWVFGNTFVSIFLAAVLALAVVPLVITIQSKVKQNANQHSNS